MRLRLAATLLLTVVLASKVNSQDISLHFKYANIDTILTELKKQTNLDYVFKAKKIDSLSIYVGGATLPEALTILFDGLPYGFTIYTSYFAINDKMPGTVEPKVEVDPEAKYVPGPPPADVTGKIVDKDGNPIAGADIQLMRSNKITSTGKDGTFIFKKIKVDGILVITRAGYETLTFVMVGKKDLGAVLLAKKN
jgi:hypothetical protein